MSPKDHTVVFNYITRTPTDVAAAVIAATLLSLYNKLQCCCNINIIYTKHKIVITLEFDVYTQIEQLSTLIKHSGYNNYYNDAVIHC